MNEFEMDDLMDDQETLSFTKKCLLVFSEPSRAFAAMKEKESYLGVLCIYYLVSFLAVIVALQGTQGQFDGIDPATLQFVKAISYVTATITVLVAPFFVGFLYHIFAMIKGYPGFNKTMRAYLYSAMISSLGGLLSVIISLVSKSQFSFSPIIFVDPIMRMQLPYALLSNINLFGIWALIAFFIGLKKVHNMKNGDAIFTVAIPVIIGLAISFVPYLVQGQL